MSKKNKSILKKYLSYIARAIKEDHYVTAVILIVLVVIASYYVVDVLIYLFQPLYDALLSSVGSNTIEIEMLKEHIQELEKLQQYKQSAEPFGKEIMIDR